jgi:hypothetical protein
MSDLFCLVSREDPFPLVVLEAAALGKPTVCFQQAGGTPEFCALGGGIAVPYLDVDAMAAVLIELIEGESRRSELGQRAAQLAREQFDIEVMGPRLMELIERWARPAAPTRVCPQSTVPDDIEGLLGQARFHQAQGHFVLAELLVEQVLDVNPAHPEARRLLTLSRGKGDHGKDGVGEMPRGKGDHRERDQGAHGKGDHGETPHGKDDHGKRAHHGEGGETVTKWDGNGDLANEPVART